MQARRALGHTGSVAVLDTLDNKYTRSLSMPVTAHNRGHLITGSETAPGIGPHLALWLQGWRNT